MPATSPKLKVTIADSSSFSRLVLSEMVEAQPDLEVLDTAADAYALMASLRKHRPDVVLAHLDLPHYSRNFIFRQVQQESGVPVLMMLNGENSVADTMREVKPLGVYDYVLQPAQKLRPRLREVQGEILEKIRLVREPQAYTVSNAVAAAVLSLRTQVHQQIPKGVVVIGASTGGTKAIEKIVSELDPKLDACVLIAVHLPAGFTRSFARRLQTLTTLKVVEGKAGLGLKKGKIIVAPGGQDMVLIGAGKNLLNYRIGFSPEASDRFDSPSVDKLMRSVAGLTGQKTLGVVLTGMGTDGTAGLQAILSKGGITLAQDQASSAIFGMAKSAIEKGAIAHVRALPGIPAFINKFIAELPEAR